MVSGLISNLTSLGWQRVEAPLYQGCTIMALAPAGHPELKEHLPGCEVLPHNPQSCTHAEGFHHGLDGTDSTHLSFKAHDLQLSIFQGADAKTVNEVGRKKAELFLEAQSRPSTAGAFQPPPTRALRHSPWLTSHHGLGRETASCLGSEVQRLYCRHCKGGWVLWGDSGK